MKRIRLFLFLFLFLCTAAAWTLQAAPLNDPLGVSKAAHELSELTIKAPSGCAFTFESGSSLIGASGSTVNLGSCTLTLPAISLSTGVTGTLAVTHGGTGLATLNLGDVLYASAANTIAALAKDTNSTRYLSNRGTGNIPSWTTIDLPSGVAGTLAIANGGTGITSYTVGDIPYATGTTTLSKLVDVATGRVLISGGAGVAPAWSTTPTFTATNVIGLPLTTGITGTLAASNGGTGQTSFAVGDLLYADTTSTIAKLPDVAGGSFLRSGNVATAPAWSMMTLPNTIASGGILYASSANTMSALAIGSNNGFLMVTGAGSTIGWVLNPPLGTPSSGNLGSCTGYTVNNLAGAGSGITAFLATASSANLATALLDETGSGAVVFATNPTLAGSTNSGALTFTGTAGASYILLPYQSSAPATPAASKVVFYPDATGIVSWMRSDGFVAQIDSTGITASRKWTMSDHAGTIVNTGDTGTVTGTMLVDGTITNADINASASIDYSKLNLATSIVNADIAAGAAIVDTKLATISTASKVSNSATTATDANTASAIVARDGSGNFSAGAITATGATINGVLGGTWRSWTQGTGTVTVASTAYVDITGLSASIGASETWLYHVILPITGATNGCKFQVTGPASPTAVEIDLTGNFASSSQVGREHVTAFSTPNATAMFTGAITSYLDMWILVQNGANAGTVQVQFATASGTNTITALANRWIEGTRKN